jgi:hypothetical protein
MPAEQVDAIRGFEPSGGTPRQRSVSRSPAHRPALTLLEEVAMRPSIAHLRVETDDELVEWRRRT